MRNRRRLLHRTALTGVAAALSVALPAGTAHAMREDGPPIPDVRISLRLIALDGGELRDADRDATANTLLERADALGGESASMQLVPPDRVIIGVTGVSDLTRTMAAIVSRGLVELVDPKGEFLEQGTHLRTTVGGDPWPRWDGARPLVAPGIYETVVDGSQIAEVSRSTNQFGQPIVTFQLTEVGGAALRDFTESHIGEPLAIVVDNRVISSPIVQAVIEREGLIEGLEPFEVDALVIQLQLEPLRARIEVERYVVDPSVPFTNEGRAG